MTCGAAADDWGDSWGNEPAAPEEAAAAAKPKPESSPFDDDPWSTRKVK